MNISIIMLHQEYIRLKKNTLALLDSFYIYKCRSEDSSKRITVELSRKPPPYKQINCSFNANIFSLYFTFVASWLLLFLQIGRPLSYIMLSILGVWDG